MTAPIAPCPTCGTPTVGTLIVGRIYDHGCQACSDQIDALFDSFIGRLVSGELDDEIDAAADGGDA
jgi:hypothetical protein